MKKLKIISIISVMLASLLVLQSIGLSLAETTLPNEVALCDWSQELRFAKTSGWASGVNNNLKDISSGITVENGTMTVDTAGMTFSSQLVQLEIPLDTQQVEKAITAAENSDGHLRVTFKLFSAASIKQSVAEAGFKMYCYANGDWQNGPTLIEASDNFFSAREVHTFLIPITALDGIVPDTLAINVQNLYYQDGLKSLKFSVSSVVSGGEDATVVTTEKDTSNFRKAEYEDYGNLINHRLLGDVDTDGEISSIDLMCIKKITANWEVDSADTVAADVFEDGKIDARDVYSEKLIMAGVQDAVHRPVTTDGYKNHTSYYQTNADGNYVINGKEYEMAFCDEFEGDALDTSKWNLCPEQDRQDFSVWRDDMVALNGQGDVVLSCAVDEERTDKVKTGAIRSSGKFNSTYGYYECRALLQQYSKGFWGAFWLMPYSIDNGTDGGKDGTEIDIFESAYFTTDRVQQGIHYDGYGYRHKSIGSANYARDLYYGYHTFGLEWSPEGYKFYIDGVLSYELKNGYTYNGNTVVVSQAQSYLKLSVESGNWTGKFKPSDTPNNIDGITVDYVKVYTLVE